MKIIDANILLRYLLADNEQLTAKAINIIENNNVHIPFEVVCEIVYVLQKVYNISRKNICKELIDFFTSPNITTNSLPVLKKALTIFNEKNIDFVDSILCAYNKTYQHEIFTFDKKMLKIINSQK